MVTVRGDADETLRLVAQAHDQCYIANSLLTPVTLHPEIRVESQGTLS